MMDRNREARRVSMAASNGLSRRRHRSSNSLRDSPEDDGPLELQETARLRDRKKDRDRERERERDRDRERERDRRSKRRRGGDRLIHNREDGGGGGGGGADDSSEESVNDDEDEDDEDAATAGAGNSSMRMLPPNPSSLSSSSLSNHHHRKSFPPPSKAFRTTPPPQPVVVASFAAAAPWKAPDELIGMSVPRKARSASTKRSHECWASSGGVVGGEQIHRQASTSPVRSSGPAMLASASASPAPVSPSSSNASVKKKMKPNGPKHRPPKSLPKSTNSAQEEIEIEIAEVLYGLLRQPQGPTKQEIMGVDSVKMDSSSREVNNNNNKSTGDAKSRVSSPISNSQSAAVQLQSSIPTTNSSSSNTPMSAIAPKRKRPRPVKYEDENPSNFVVRNSVISSTTKVDNDQTVKVETLPNLEKNSGENGGVTYDLLANQAVAVSNELQPEQAKQENNNLLMNSRPLTEERESRDSALAKDEPRSPKKESPPPGLRLEDDRESLTMGKTNSTVPEAENQREEKFQIDLMAPPPLRSSPERDSEIDFVSVDPKAMVTDVETEVKPIVNEDGKKAVKIGKEDMNVEPEEKKAKVMVAAGATATADEVESHKPIIVNNNKERNIDLQLDLEKTDRDGTTVTVSGNKLPHQHHVQKQQLQPPTSEKNAQPSSLPLPMSMASWPGGLPHMGYMAPLQGVVSMDGSAVSSAAIQHPHWMFTQPRPKRCATHWYIARNIHYHQQFTRMNPFWPPAAGSALQYGAKACNMNVVPPTELHAGRGVNSVQDKGQGLAIFPAQTGKDKSSQAPNIVETAQRKQILLQQALPPGAPNSILHGPAFIFPLGQQPAAAAASVRPGTMKSPAASGSASSSASSSASISATAAAVAGATPMSFNYPSMLGNETQYLTILQNGPYPIPISAHVGTTPAYRGAHPPGMPFFNGSFYSSQMLHPSQLQQQQPPATQSPQSQQGHPNPSISSGSSSSQKHLQNQQPRPHGSGINGSSGNLQGFPGPKNLPSQSLQLQQRQQTQNNNVPHQARQLEGELGSEDSPSTADSRVARANMSMYGQNFTYPPNLAFMTPASISGANSVSGNPSEKKQQPQHQGTKPVVEPLPSQAFGMSFTSFNGATTGPAIDLLQSIQEATRHGYHFVTAGAVGQPAQPKKNFRASEEGKAGGNDASNAEEERKAMTGGKAAVTAGQSIAFSRPDLTDTSVSTMPGNTVIDTSARPLNLGSAAGRSSSAVVSAGMSTANAASVQQQLQRNQQQQQQQMIQLQKQHQYTGAAVAPARGKTTATSNGSVYSDHISTSSSMATKFPNALSAFPPNLVQGSSSPAQSPQWKSSARATTPQVSSPTLSSTSSSLKNLSQQQGRTQPSHTQISFAASPKPSAAPQVQPPPSTNQSPSPPMVVGSPTTSSISKSAGGSPRTTATSTSNKGGQSSTLSSQQPKNSPSIPAQKSSPAGGRNIHSILGHPHNTTSSSSSGMKPQLPQQQQQQQHLQKHTLQTQMLYNNAYMQAQAQHAASSGNNVSAAGGFYLQRHRDQQQPQGSFSTSSTGMLSLCTPVTLATSGTNDPAKAAAAAAASSMKGVGLPSHGLIHAQFAAAQSSGKPHQIVPGFSFVHAHAAPSTVQVKQAEQKQPAGE